MVLADGHEQFLLHLEIYLIYERERDVGHYLQLCLLLAVFVVSTLKQSKKDSKDQESIQSSTTPVPEYQMGK